VIRDLIADEVMAAVVARREALGADDEDQPRHYRRRVHL